MKNGISLLLAIILIFSVGVTALAQINDISTHWSNQEISYLVDRGVLDGYPDGTFKPDNPMSKVEFYKVINGLLDFEETVEVTYLDVQVIDWFYENVGKALSAGYISPATLLQPNEYITRKEVSRILGVVYNLNDKSEAANIFLDSALLSQETKGYIGVLLENDLLHGYPDGTFKPTANITRAEVVKLIYNVLGKLNDLPLRANADKSELEEEIEDAEELRKSNYTSSTWKKLESALEAAVEVFEDKDVTQLEIDDALDDLLDAIDNLKKITSSRTDRDDDEPSIVRYSLTKGTNKITSPVTIRTGTVKGNVTINYTRRGDLELPAGLTIEGNLTVIAPKATINNYATVTGDIIVKDVASTTWNEFADGNTLIIEDENGLVLNIVGDVVGITVSTTADGEIIITVADNATITSLVINAPVTIISSNPIQATIISGVEVVVKSDKDAAETTVTGTGVEVKLEPEEVVVPVNGISVSPTTMTLAEGGETRTISATVSPANATNKTVTWTTSKAEVATVAGGVVTPVGAGTATITATAGGKTTSTTVTVEAVAGDAITLTPARGTETVTQGANLTGSVVTLSSNYDDTGLMTVISLKKDSKAENFNSIFETFNLSTQVGQGAADGPYNMVGAYDSFEYGPPSGYSVIESVDQVTTTAGKVKADAPVGTYMITSEVKDGETVLASATYELIVEAVKVNTIALNPASGTETVPQGANLTGSVVTLSSNYDDTGLMTVISLKKDSKAENFNSIFETFNLSTQVDQGAVDGPYNMVGAYDSFEYGPPSGYSVTESVDQVTTTAGKVKADAPVGTYIITSEVKDGETLLASATYEVIVVIVGE